MPYKSDHKAAVLFSSGIRHGHIPVSPQKICGLHTAIFPVISQQSGNLPTEHCKKRAQGLVLGAAATKPFLLSLLYNLGVISDGHRGTVFLILTGSWKMLTEDTARKTVSRGDPLHPFHTVSFMVLLLRLLFNLLGLLLVITSLWH